MDNVSMAIAFSAGLLSFLSPCVLPLIPAYVSYLTGASIEELQSSRAKINALYRSLGFVLGFSIVFIIMGMSISSLGKLFAQNQNIFRKVGGTLIIVFGLHTMRLLKIKLLYFEKRFHTFGKKGISFSPILMGIAFAAGWTPCVGPILSSILIYAGNMETVSKGIQLLVIYSLGLAVPFVLTAVTIGSFARYFKRFSKYLPVISIISGILMIAMGLMVFTNKINILSQYLNFINLQ